MAQFSRYITCVTIVLRFLISFISSENDLSKSVPQRKRFLFCSLIPQALVFICYSLAHNALVILLIGRRSLHRYQRTIESSIVMKRYAERIMLMVVFLYLMLCDVQSHVMEPRHKIGGNTARLQFGASR